MSLWYNGYVSSRFENIYFAPDSSVIDSCISFIFSFNYYYKNKLSYLKAQKETYSSRYSVKFKLVSHGFQSPRQLSFEKKNTADLFFKNYIILFNLGGCCLNVCLCSVCVPGPCEGQKRKSPSTSVKISCELTCMLELFVKYSSQLVI